VKRVQGVDGTLLAVNEINEEGWTLLDNAHAVIFGAPAYMGAPPAKFVEFMDASSKRWYTRAWSNKLAAGFSVSSSQIGDKPNVMTTLMIFALQHGMIWVGLDVLGGNNTSTGTVNDVNRLGGYTGAYAQAAGDKGAEAMLDSDLETAALLGERVAKTALRFN